MKKTNKFKVLLMSTVFLLASCGGQNKLRKAYDAITERYSNGDVVLKIAGDDSFLKTDTNPLDLSNFYIQSYVDISKATLFELGFQESTWEKMINTTALNGVRTDSIKGLTVEWTYHPNHGLEATYTLSK